MKTHVETHFRGTDTVKDIVIGMSDGLTVPFALAAGISGAISANHIVITAGFAEIAAGSIAMGLGGYLAAKSEAEHYASELKREEEEIRNIPDMEAEEVADVFKAYGIEDAAVTPIVDAFRKKPDAWRDFMMRFELGLEEPDPRRALASALTISVSYIVGGIIPLSPYMLNQNTHQALLLSIVFTLTALAIFGFIKGHFTGVPKIKSGFQTLLVGGLAAAVAYGIAKLIS